MQLGNFIWFNAKKLLQYWPDNKYIYDSKNVKSSAFTSKWLRDKKGDLIQKFSCQILQNYSKHVIFCSSKYVLFFRRSAFCHLAVSYNKKNQSLYKPVS